MARFVRSTAASVVVLGLSVASSAHSAMVTGDFDGDGYDDMAVGRGNTVRPATLKGAGAVAVFPGTEYGLRWASAELTQSHGGGRPEPGDGFGHALAAGDFDGDGIDDLAVGAPGEGVGGLRPKSRAGVISVIYGRRGAGLGGRATQFRADQAAGRTAALARFGSTLAAADFDGDGFTDLAIGAPWERAKGRVTVMKGSASGLVAHRAVALRGSGLLHRVGSGAGSSLAAGDLDADGFADLAIAGVSFPVGPGVVGGVGVIPGTPGGLHGSALKMVARPGTPACGRFARMPFIAPAAEQSPAELVVDLNCGLPERTRFFRYRLSGGLLSSGVLIPGVRRNPDYRGLPWAAGDFDGSGTVEYVDPSVGAERAVEDAVGDINGDGRADLVGIWDLARERVPFWNDMRRDLVGVRLGTPSGLGPVSAVRHGLTSRVALVR